MLDLELTAGSYGGGYCYFKTEDGERVRLSVESCIEVFATVAEALDFDPQQRDEIYFTLIDSVE